MTKKILSGIALVAGLMSCTEDFTNWASPQSNDANEAAQTLQMTVTPAISSIDFANITGETIQLFSTTLSAEEAKEYTVDIAGDGIDETTTITADAKGNVATADLRDAVTYLFGAAPKDRSLTIKVFTIAINQTADGPVKVRRVADPFSLTAKLDAPYIAQNYYIVGGPNDWNDAPKKQIKFNHSGKDVYEDPVFTVVFDAAASGDTWFAIGDDEACEAIPNDWSKLLGIVGGDNQAASGKLDVRSNMGADNSFCVPAGAKKIKVTINMMEYTFTVEPVNISDSYYLIGGNGEWNDSKEQKFSHSDKNVFDDPVFTYVIEGGKELWFAFGDAEAIDATAAGDWNQLFGYKGDGGFTGSFDRRSALGGEYTFHLDGSAKFYRFSVNMAEMTYTITALNFDPFIYFIGATDGWANAEQKLALTDESGIYTGYIYCADPNGWGNCFKFQKVPGDWGTEINTGHMTGGMTGGVGLHDGDTNFEIKDGEGVYFMTVNMATMSIDATKITNMNLVGDFNSWSPNDDAQQMTWDAENYCYVITGAGVNANGWKFTANNGWDINLGANDTVEPSGVIDDLVGFGKNLNAVGTTIKLYPTRKTSDKIYCTVE